MQEIIKQIGTLHDSLIEKHKKLDSVAADQAEVSSRILESSSALSAREHAIVGREHEVKKIEDVIALKAEAEALMDKARFLITTLDGQKKAWANEKSIQEQALTNQRAGIAQSVKNNEDNRLALEKKKKDLESIINQRVSEALAIIKK